MLILSTKNFWFWGCPRDIFLEMFKKKILGKVVYKVGISTSYIWYPQLIQTSSFRSSFASPFLQYNIKIQFKDQVLLGMLRKKLRSYFEDQRNQELGKVVLIRKYKNIWVLDKRDKSRKDIMWLVSHMRDRQWHFFKRKTLEYSSKRIRNYIQERHWLDREFLYIILAPSLQNRTFRSLSSWLPTGICVKPAGKGKTTLVQSLYHYSATAFPTL